MTLPEAVNRLSALKEFDAKLARHDWYYQNSDDHSVWMRGNARHAELVGLAKASPQHQELYDLWFRHRFTGKPWGTTEFTQAELDAERTRLLATPGADGGAA